ncbi:hypothetical protein FGM00_19650 [Aggregatimonas sangjinii]|uniref:Uncharacterized protein n=1 Tax=Aggregatimonas sangjinii TaxID=2583587 RepID=A0A5B7SYS5_9FLAO|nr:hypothetical protein [Aggregatimonas sangjinii]QCX02223.1 hypothetical protein FGM00_19650 [Aggregatimonas sangjinii]
MRNSIFFVTLLLSFFMLQGQSNDYNFTQGDELILGAPKGSRYKAINFPRKNIIIKRGALANFNALIGKQLIISRLETDDEGKTIVTLKRKDGLNFFRFFPKVTADLDKALAFKELKRQKA